MKRTLPYILIFVVVAGIAHYLTLSFTPRAIMNRTFDVMQTRGMKVGAFTLVLKSTPQTQNVVRPSPDLAYSVCLFDFSETPGPLAVKAAAWRDMGSLSLYDADTNNFARYRIDEDANGGSVIMYPPGVSVPDHPGAHSVAAPTKRGIILIRRLAPTLETHKGVREISGGDSCGPLN